MKREEKQTLYFYLSLSNSLYISRGRGDFSYRDNKYYYDDIELEEKYLSKEVRSKIKNKKVYMRNMHNYRNIMVRLFPESKDVKKVTKVINKSLQRKAEKKYKLVKESLNGMYDVILGVEYNKRIKGPYKTYTNKHRFLRQISVKDRDIIINLGEVKITNYVTGNSITRPSFTLVLRSDNKFYIGALETNLLHGSYIHPHVSFTDNYIKGADFCTNQRSVLVFPAYDISIYMNSLFNKTKEEEENIKLTICNYVLQIIDYLKQESTAGIPYWRISQYKANSLTNLPIFKQHYIGRYTEEDIQTMGTNSLLNLLNQFGLKKILDEEILIFNIVKQKYEVAHDSTEKIIKNKEFFNFLYERREIFILLYSTDETYEGSTHHVPTLSLEEEEMLIRNKCNVYITLNDFLAVSKSVNRDVYINTIYADSYKERKIVGYTDDHIYLYNKRETPVHISEFLHGKLSLNMSGIKIFNFLDWVNVYHIIKEHTEQYESIKE